MLGHIVRLYGHTNSVHSAGLKVQTFLWLALGARYSSATNTVCACMKVNLLDNIRSRGSKTRCLIVLIQKMYMCGYLTCPMWWQLRLHDAHVCVCALCSLAKRQLLAVWPQVNFSLLQACDVTVPQLTQSLLDDGRMSSNMTCLWSLLLISIGCKVRFHISCYLHVIYFVCRGGKWLSIFIQELAKVQFCFKCDFLEYFHWMQLCTSTLFILYL